MALGGGEYENDPQRMRMRRRGFRFCDEDGELHTDSLSHLFKAANQATCLDELNEEGIIASTTDHPRQAIENTLVEDFEFWSSTGSPTIEGTEFLTYRLKHPACLIHSIRISVYRAVNQLGQPIYPPRFVAFDVGSSPEALHRVSKLYPVGARDGAQIFQLPTPLVAVGGYLRVWMDGKPQMQLYDGKYYIAIQQVSIHGLPLPESLLSRIPRGLATSSVVLQNGSYCPTIGLEHLCAPGQMSVMQEANRRWKRRQEKMAEYLNDSEHTGDEREAYNTIRLFLRMAWQPAVINDDHGQSSRSKSDPSQSLSIPKTLFNSEKPKQWDVYSFTEQMVAHPQHIECEGSCVEPAPSGL